MKKVLLFSLVAIIFASCVTQKKYDALNKNCETTKDSLYVALAGIQKDISDLEQRNEKLNTDVVKLRTDTSSLHRQVTNLDLQVKELKELNTNLTEKQSNLMKQNAIESKNMLEALQFAREDLQKREDALDSVRVNLELERANLDKIRKELGIKNDEILEKNRKIAEMEELIHRKDSLSNALKTKVKNALVGFEGQGLSIEERDGKIYVLLDESLLFSVGKSDVAVKGQEALKKLADVLAQNTDIDIMIEGHTDNTGGSAINWKLSTQRALAISQILLNNSEIEGKRITVAGRGQYVPIDTADTQEARAKNRRSEIILTPDLKELYDLINN